MPEVNANIALIHASSRAELTMDAMRKHGFEPSMLGFNKFHRVYNMWNMSIYLE